MDDARFDAWKLVRVRGRGEFRGSAWRVAAHIYRDRAINCMRALRMQQADMRVWEQAYTELETERDALEAALAQIDRHVVGACESDTGGLPEPCEECGEMREIAAQALAGMPKGRSE